jgi:hypothetical protein
MAPAGVCNVLPQLGCRWNSAPVGGPNSALPPLEVLPRSKRALLAAGVGPQIAITALGSAAGHVLGSTAKCRISTEISYYMTCRALQH